jgi:hypothetical protein
LSLLVFISLAFLYEAGLQNVQMLFFALGKLPAYAKQAPNGDTIPSTGRSQRHKK